MVIDCPENTGSNFFNYKGSIVLLASGDANYCFTAVDVGQYDSDNDSDAFANCDITKALESNSFNVPEPEHVQGCADKLPYVTLVDEGLPLKQYQIRPYPGKNLTEERAIFNYRLSRARRIIENILGFSLHDGEFFAVQLEPMLQQLKELRLHVLLCTITCV